ncbi:MAG TPA: hypothetical protein VNL91_09880 [Thermoanaerobaculia bacterium]|nr:hypothetical protein [Thermoanaerobaculia bacterium]
MQPRGRRVRPVVVPLAKSASGPPILRASPALLVANSRSLSPTTRIRRNLTRSSIEQVPEAEMKVVKEVRVGLGSEELVDDRQEVVKRANG